jgi:hypothetical protein
MALETQRSRLHDEMQRQERKAEAEQWYCTVPPETPYRLDGKMMRTPRPGPACLPSGSDHKSRASQRNSPTTMFIAIAIVAITIITIIIIVRPTPAQSGDAAGVSKNVETRQILPDAALIRLLHVPLSHVDFVHAAGPSPTYRHFCDTTGGRVRICRDWRATWTSTPHEPF